MTGDGPRRLLITAPASVDAAGEIGAAGLAEIIEPRTTRFDHRHPYCASLVDVGADGVFKFVATPDDWAPSWSVDASGAAHVLVTVREIAAVGRPGRRSGRYRVLLTGGDDLCCVADVDGRESAVALFDSVRDEITVHQAIAAGFTCE